MPQGSILGPLLFLLYINDITNSTQNLEFVLYADDTTLFYSQPDISNLKENIESELSKVTTWFKINRLLVNFDKTHFVSFHNRSSNISNALENFFITIDSHTLNKCNSVNFLGIHIDRHLKWNTHIDYNKIKFQSVLVFFISLNIIYHHQPLSLCIIH